MATFLDSLGVLSFFAPLFAGVLVFVMVLALLLKTKILGDNKALSGVIAVILGILVLLLPDVVAIINFVAPWFVLMFIFLILLMMTYQIFGLTDKDIGDYFRADKGVNWAIFAVGMIIILAGVFSVFGQRALEITQTGEVDGEKFESNLFDVIFSPQVLGIIVIFAIAVFTVGLLGGEPPVLKG